MAHSGNQTPTSTTGTTTGENTSQDKKIEEILNHFHLSANWREANYEEKAKRYYKLYRAFRKKKATGKSNLHIPKAHETVETATAALFAAMFPKRPYANFRAKTAGASESARATGRFIDYQLSDIMNFDVDANISIKQMVGYGTFFAKVGWKREVSTIRTKIPRLPDYVSTLGINPTSMGFKVIEQEVPIYDAPTFELMSWWDAYPHPEEKAGMQKRLPFIHRRYMPLSELKRVQEPQYKNLDQLDALGSWNNLEASMVRPQDEMGETRAEEDKNETMVEVLEYWHEQGRRVATVVNREVLIRDEKNPFFHAQHPIVSTPYSADMEGGVYGMSIIETVESLIFELIDMRNQTMDNVSLGLRAPLVADYTRLDDPENTVFSINNLIGVQGEPSRVIQKLDVPDYTGRVVHLDPIIKGEIASDTGITDYAKGTSADGISNETATGISLLIEQVNKRLMPTVRLYQKTTMVPLLRMMKHLNHQFIEEVEFPYDNGFENVNHQHFKPDFDILPTGSVAYTSKQLRLRQLRDLEEGWRGHANINPVPLMREIMELSDILNIDEILIPEPPEAKPEDPKMVYTLRGDLSPGQQASTLEQYGVETSPLDLLKQDIDFNNDIAAGKLKTQNALTDRRNQTEERTPIDKQAEGSKKDGGKR